MDAFVILTSRGRPKNLEGSRCVASLSNAVLFQTSLGTTLAGSSLKPFAAAEKQGQGGGHQNEHGAENPETQWVFRAGQHVEVGAV